jgi:hypothetical protein
LTPFSIMDHTSLQRGYTYSLEADWLNGRASASYHALGHPRRNQDSGRLWVRVPCWLIHSDRVISNFGVRFPGYATYSFAFLLLLMFDGLRFLEGGQLCVGTWNFSRNCRAFFWVDGLDMELNPSHWQLSMSNISLRWRCRSITPMAWSFRF